MRGMIDRRRACERAVAQYNALNGAERDRFVREQRKRLAPVLRPYQRAEAAKRYREHKKREKAVTA